MKPLNPRYEVTVKLEVGADRYDTFEYFQLYLENTSIPTSSYLRNVLETYQLVHTRK